MMYRFYRFSCGRNYYSFIPLIILIITIFVCYRLIVSHNHKKSYSDVLNDLNRKFVNGEITEDEYLKRKQIITRK